MNCYHILIGDFFMMIQGQWTYGVLWRENNPGKGDYKQYLWSGSDSLWCKCSLLPLLSAMERTYYIIIFVLSRMCVDDGISRFDMWIWLGSVSFGVICSACTTIGMVWVPLCFEIVLELAETLQKHTNSRCLMDLCQWKCNCIIK